MVGSNVTDHDHHHHLTDGDDHDGGLVPPSSGVSCSICLELVSDNGGRSRAKLQCGHEFHLDCIGSAFNVKGAMQCPNCRKIEKGQWLYASGSTRSFPEFSFDDWNPDEDFYDLSYTEMPFRVQWCPFGDFTRMGSSFEEVESPSTTYHELQGHHTLFAEHTAASSMAHSYVAYVGPLPPTTSRSRSDSVDDANFNRHWNGLSGHEIYSPHAFPAINIHYHSWGRHSPTLSVGSHFSSVDPSSVPPGTVRSSHVEPDRFARSRSYPHPFPYEHGSSSRAGSSFVSAIFPPHPGSNERIHVTHAFHHQLQPTNRPSLPPPLVPGMRRGLPTVLPAPSQPEQNGGFYIFPPSSSSGQNSREAESSLPNRFHAWERERLSHFPVMSRESGWGTYQTIGGSDSGNRSSSFQHRPFS